MNETSTDRLINRTWSWDVVAIPLYQAAVELHRPDLGRSLYLGAALMGIASFYGMARLLDGADPGSARRRQRQYDSISAAIAISLILGTPAVRGAFGIDLLFAFSIYWSASFVIMIGRALAGTPPRESGTAAAVVVYLMQFMLTLLTGTPLVTVLPARTGWDRTGRTCRRLRPLWYDLTAAVPEVVLRDARSTPWTRTRGSTG